VSALAPGVLLSMPSKRGPTFAVDRELTDRFKHALYGKGQSTNQVLEGFMERVVQACDGPPDALKDLLDGIPRKKPKPEEPDTSAAGRLKDIAWCRSRIALFEDEIVRHRKERIVIEHFNPLSEPIDGQTLEEGDLDGIGTTPCEFSPIGVCVTCEEVVCLPVQRAEQAWAIAHKGTPEEFNQGLEAHVDACLFCGKRDQRE
jgi:hypothetical protein